MRRVRRVLWVLALATLAVAPAHATSVTVQMTGEWFQVIDNANVSGGSIASGGSFTVNLTYDDATLDINGDPSVGDYVLPAVTSSLTLETGGFTFSLLAAETVVLSVGDGFLDQDDLNIFAQNFTTSGPLPVGVTTGAANTSALLVDSTETAHSSDAISVLPWSVAAYDSPNQGMYFLIQVLGAGPSKKIELFGEFTEFQVLPEPTALTLFGFACATLAWWRSRG